MSDLWAYNPDVCDGDVCWMNCDNCPKHEKAAGYADEDEEEDE